MIKVSIFASAVRPKIWEECLSSFKSTSVSFEVIFAGNSKPEDVQPFLDKYKFFKYIYTKNIKPSQVYEVSLRACIGETVIWFADDAETPNDVIGKAYNYWKGQNNEKLILSIQTKESGYPRGGLYLFDMRNHTFFGYKKDTPLMAPLALMSRKFLNDLGGIDKRYVCGQYENDLVMRAYNEGATVEIFGGEGCSIDIDHWEKSIICKEGNFLKRPFATGYEKDREVLEKSWCPLKKDNDIWVRNDTFQPFEDKDILTKSQSNKGQWE